MYIYVLFRFQLSFENYQNDDDLIILKGTTSEIRWMH